MKIQVDTDGNIDEREKLGAQAISAVASAVSRFSDRIALVKIDLNERIEEGRKQHGKRCTMEARLTGRQPIAVVHAATTFREAVDGAADELERSIAKTLEQLYEDDQAARERAAPQDEAEGEIERRGDERWENEGGSL